MENNKISKTFSIDREIAHYINELSYEMRIPRSQVIEEAVKLLLKKGVVKRG